MLTVQHKSLRLQCLQLILNSPHLGVQGTAQDQARKGLPQRPTHMLGPVGAFTVATRQHSICINAAPAWCVTFWGRGPGKSPPQSQKMLPGARLPQPGSALHPFLVTGSGLAQVAEAWASTATAPGLVAAGAGEGSGPASPAVSPPGRSHAGLPPPSPCPPLWTASLGGSGSSQCVALERRLRGPLLGLISPFSPTFLTWGS